MNIINKYPISGNDSDKLESQMIDSKILKKNITVYFEEDTTVELRANINGKEEIITITINDLKEKLLKMGGEQK